MSNDALASRPRARFVDAAGARLHALSWGGDGDPLVFIPGGGQSAHVFSGIAPAFTDTHRVLGVTPRGHGPSDTPPDGYTVRGFADDLRRALDALAVQRAVLVPHSVAGVVVTRFAADHPSRVAAVVYLDALMDYAGLSRMQAKNPVKPPPLFPFGSDPSAAEKDWLRRYYYPRWTEELEADWRARPPHDVVRRRRVLLAQFADDASREPLRYAAVQAPALAIVSEETVDTVYPWLAADDAVRRRRAEEHLRGARSAWRRAEISRFTGEVPHARVVSFPAHHFAFVFQRERVIREMRGFLASAAGGAA
jgi:pimeloyl-ACP methyl ester carboxylesterase